MLYLHYTQDWKRISMFLELLEQSGLYRKYIWDGSDPIKHFFKLDYKTIESLKSRYVLLY